MKIENIIMENIKGQTGVQPLTGRDIFIGRNGSGKTTRLQTIGTALLGYVPGQGKTNAETFKLSTGDYMTVGIDTEGFNFFRQFEKTTKENKKTGAMEVNISQDIVLSPSQGEETFTKRNMRVAMEVGNYPVMMDFNEFLSLSDSKRREFFYNLNPVRISNWTRESIETYLKVRLATTELKQNNPDKYKAMESAIMETLGSWPMKTDVHCGIVTMIDFAKNKKSLWKEKKDNAEGAAKQMAEEKNKLAETDNQIAESKTKLDELQQNLITLSELIASNDVRERSIKSKEDRILALRNDIKAIKESECPYDLAELDKQIISLKASFEVPGTDYAALRDEIKKKIDAEMGKLKTFQEQKQKEYESAIELTGELNNYLTAKNNIGTIKGRCFIHNKIGCDKDFSKFLEYINTAMSNINTEINLHNTEMKNLDIKIAECENQIKKLSDETVKSYSDERNWNNNQHILQTALTSATSQRNEALKFDENKALRIKEKNAEIEQLEQAAEEPILIDLDAAHKQKAAIAENINTMKKTIEDKTTYKINLINMQKAVIDNKIAAHYYDCFDLVYKEVGPRGIQGKIVATILGPIKDDIQAKFAKLGINHEFYFSMESDTGKEIFQFGWINSDGIHVNFDALSLGEKLLVLMALLISIIEKANPKLKVLMVDDIVNLDIANFKTAMDGLQKIGGNMDNIIVAGNDFIELAIGDCEEISGFKVWRLSREGTGNEQIT